MAGHARTSNVLIEQFQFETLRVPNHTACRFAEKRGFSAHFWPGGAVPPPRGSPFSKVSRSGPHQPLSQPRSQAGEEGILSKNHFFQRVTEKQKKRIKKESFSLTRGGCFDTLPLARWAVVQLAGRRILAPLIKVRVLAAQPTKLHSASPSSSRPRTTAFHAVNGGSNPPGDAKNFNRLQQLSFWVTKIGLQFFLRRPSLEEFLF